MDNMISVQFKCHAECRSNADNWAGLSDAAKRRKLQNRLNQRAFRRRKAAEKRAEQESRSGSSDATSTTASSPCQHAAALHLDQQRCLSRQSGCVELFSFTQEQFSPPEMQLEPQSTRFPGIFDQSPPNRWQCDIATTPNLVQVVPDDPLITDMYSQGFCEQPFTDLVAFGGAEQDLIGFDGADEDASSYPFQWPNETYNQDEFELWLNSTAWMSCESVIWPAPR